VVEGFPDLRNRAGDHNILNCSFGCGISGHLPIYKEWADSALLAGIHVVAASGSPETSEWPAYLSSVLGVDCALSNDTGLRYVPGRMVEFATADAEVRVPWKDRGHRVMTGSSFAAAWLSGMHARLLSVYPEMDPILAKSLLRRVAPFLYLLGEPCKPSWLAAELLT
jgi:hypothetical protein